MTTPKIQALGVTQDWSPTRWKARGYVEGVGRLEAWGTSLLGAMEALRGLAAQSGWGSKNRGSPDLVEEMSRRDAVYVG